jgi:hypothetical protein
MLGTASGIGLAQLSQLGANIIKMKKSFRSNFNGLNARLSEASGNSL